MEPKRASELSLATFSCLVSLVWLCRTGAVELSSLAKLSLSLHCSSFFLSFFLSLLLLQSILLIEEEEEYKEEAAKAN